MLEETLVLVLPPTSLHAGVLSIALPPTQVADGDAWQNGCTGPCWRRLRFLPPLIFSNFGKIGLLENGLALRGVHRSLPDCFEPGYGVSENLAMAPPFMLLRKFEVEAAVWKEEMARGGGDVLCASILFQTRRQIFS